MTWRSELSQGTDVRRAWDCPELLQGSQRAEGCTGWGNGKDACALLCSLTGQMEVQHRQWSSRSCTRNLLLLLPLGGINVTVLREGVSAAPRHETRPK